jgi:hypothetical protein
MNLIDRFESYVIPEPMTGCWLWTGGAKGRKGMQYGSFYHQGKNHAAHRMAWTLYKGEIPAGMFVCHKCDVTECVNPAHLFLGTPKDNAHDMSIKGRSRGQRTLNCSKGHALSGNNLYVSPKGLRGCKACRRKQSYNHLRKVRGSVKSYNKRSQHWNEGK